MDDVNLGVDWGTEGGCYVAMSRKDAAGNWHTVEELQPFKSHADLNKDFKVYCGGKEVKPDADGFFRFYPAPITITAIVGPRLSRRKERRRRMKQLLLERRTSYALRRQWRCLRKRWAAFPSEERRAALYRASTLFTEMFADPAHK